MQIKNKNTGFIGGLLIAVGAILCLLLIGYIAQRLDDAYYTGTYVGQNNTNTTTNTTDTENTEEDTIDVKCGIIVDSPVENSVTYSPLSVSGYVSGCDWDPVAGSIGTVSLYDSGEGGQVSSTIPLSVLTTSGGKTYFSATVSYPDTTSNLAGYLYFEHVDGVEAYSLPIKY